MYKTIYCLECGKAILTTMYINNPKDKYCSAKCKQKAYRKRKKNNQVTKATF